MNTIPEHLIVFCGKPFVEPPSSKLSESSVTSGEYSGYERIPHTGEFKVCVTDFGDTVPVGIVNGFAGVQKSIMDNIALASPDAEQRYVENTVLRLSI